MEKQDFLNELSRVSKSGEISKAELMSAIGAEEKSKSGAHHMSINRLLYIIGGAITILGIGLFISQVWDSIGAVGRISTTFGMGLILTGLGSYLLVSGKDALGQIFHFLSGVLIPGGAIVLLDEMNVNLDNIWPLAITFGILFAFYVVLSLVHKKALLTLFSIINGTAFIYFLVGAIIQETAFIYFLVDDVFAYLTMVMGICYILLAWHFREGWNKKLSNILYFFGSAGFYIFAFTRIFDTVLWQLLYFIFVIGGLFLAVYIKSNRILIVSTFALAGFVIYITSEYFADSLGWPITLIILGFFIIGLGYASVSINKKYIKRRGESSSSLEGGIQ